STETTTPLISSLSLHDALPISELLAFDGRRFPEDHPFRAIEVTPADVRLPPIWLLGSSAFSAQLAAEVGLAYSFAAHINFGAAIDRKSTRLNSSHVKISYAVFC